MSRPCPTNWPHPVRPEFSYLICGTPRCGSNLLCEALGNTGLAGIPGEYFWDEAHWARKWGTTCYTDYLHEVIKRSTTENRVFGTKVMWGYFDAFVQRVRETPGVRTAWRLFP